MEASVEAQGPIRASAEARPEARAAALHWFIYAVLLATTSIIFGLCWDISWHMSIGRDTFWSPPHMAIYLGGAVAGLSSGWVVLRTTFFGSDAERAGCVRIWGLRAPLGAFVCAWGAVAMLTSAPLDDWWHNAYGLDVQILSPPHILLGLGISAIQVGAMLTVLALQNGGERAGAIVEEASSKRRRLLLRWMFVWAAAMLLVNIAILTWERMGRILMHSSIYYEVGCGVLPLFIVAAARASRLRWPATAVTACYTAFYLALIWGLPLFHAEPKLAPVNQPLTHFVPVEFPHLLIVPAVVIDLLMRRFGRERDWRLALALGVSYFAVFTATQWLFSYFLMSPYSRNWVFGTHYFAFYLSKESFTYRHQYYPWDASTWELWRGLAWALVFAVASSRVGLWWGSWMRSVQR
jgi:hypothetical protein